MALLRRGLALDPATRPQNAAAFRDALLALPGPATAPSAAFRAPGRAPGNTAGSTAAPASGSGRVAVSAPPARRRPSAWLTGLAAVVLVIAATAVITVRILPRSTGSAAAPGATPTDSQGANQNTSPAPVGAFGIATVLAGCPAASVRSAQARCPANPECWAGLVEISGVVSAETLPCDQSHYWETFAIAIMPAGAQTFDEPTLAENPTVRAVCSLPVLLASRRVDALRIPASSWQIEVLPPTEAAYDSGDRTYRCVAAVTGSQPSISQFRRLCVKTSARGGLLAVRRSQALFRSASLRSCAAE
jgi:hypothetical protein